MWFKKEEKNKLSAWSIDSNDHGVGVWLHARCFSGGVLRLDAITFTGLREKLIETLNKNKELIIHYSDRELISKIFNIEIEAPEKEDGSPKHGNI